MLLNWRHGFLLILILLSSPDIFGDRISRALKNLEKGKYQKVESLISKSLDKHPANPGAYYVLSLLYYDSAYYSHFLDSSHYFIEVALRQHEMRDSLPGRPLEKSKLTRRHLLLQKHSVDSTAFHWALAQNSVSSFQHFIDTYTTAAQRENAVELRDQLAFENASALHTYKSYLTFMETYPQAKQVPEAAKRYHLLLFQSMTAGGKLQDYVNFLERNPGSPYRLRAEKQIFELQTLDNRPQSYLGFIKGYPNSPLAIKANDYLYHLDRSLVPTALWQSDSLSLVRQLDEQPLVAVYENKRYGFMDRDGGITIPISYDSIPENLLCEQLVSDVLPFYDEGRWKLAGRNRGVFLDKPYDGFRELGQGLVEVRHGGKLGVIHKGGWQVLPVEYDDIKFLEPGLIAFNKEGRWGLSCPNGRLIIPPDLAQISSEGRFLALRRQAGWAIQNQNKLLDWYQTGSQELLYQYQDWELITPGHLLVFQDEKEGVINQQLQMVVPLSKHKIYEVDSLNWYAKTSHGTVRFYGDQLSAIPPDRFENFIATEHYICLERSAKWEVWDRAAFQMLNEKHYDSVARLGNELLLLREADLTTVLFPNAATLSLGPRQTLRYLRSPSQTRGFLQVSSRGGLREVYNLEGEKFYRTWYFDMQPLTEELLIIEKNDQRGVINIQGQVILKPRYETVVNDNSRHLTLLSRGRFGFYDVPSRSLISPQYESRIAYFKEGLLLAAKGGRKGLIDLRNRLKVPFEYDDIQPWSDSVVLLKEDRSWSLYNYITKSFELQDISLWQWQRNDLHKFAIFRINGGYGLIDNQGGVMLDAVYSDIVNLGSPENPLFVTEQKIADGDQYQIRYYNQDHRVIREQIVSTKEHDKFWCF